MTNMKTSPNQKAVTVYKAPCDKENKYAKINIEAMSLAARTLDFKSFELWIYFAKNQDKHQFALSNAAVRNEFGMKKDSYDSAIANLISAGYLKKINGNLVLLVLGEEVGTVQLTISFQTFLFCMLTYSKK